MNPAVEQLLQSALKLPEEDQLKLLSALTAAVEERGLRPFDDSWLAEIQRRSDEYDAGAVQSIPWTVVKEGARQKATIAGPPRSTDGQKQNLQRRLSAHETSPEAGSSGEEVKARLRGRP